MQISNLICGNLKDWYILWINTRLEVFQVISLVQLSQLPPYQITLKTDTVKVDFNELDRVGNTTSSLTQNPSVPILTSTTHLPDTIILPSNIYNNDLQDENKSTSVSYSKEVMNSTTLGEFVNTNIDSYEMSIDDTISNTAPVRIKYLAVDSSEILIGSNDSNDISAGIGSDVVIAAEGDDTITLVGNTYHTAYFAHNVGSSTQVATNVTVSLVGKVKLETVIDGGADADTVNLSAEGDAFFLHDSFSDFHSHP